MSALGPTLGLLLLVAPFGPFASPRFPVTRETWTAAAAPDDSGGRFLLRLYARAFSDINGPSCIHRPSCSRYAIEAVERYRFVGVLLAVDRLMRGPSSSALRMLRLRRGGGEWRFDDPLEASTFWFD